MALHFLCLCASSAVENRKYWAHKIYSCNTTRTRHKFPRMTRVGIAEVSLYDGQGGVAYLHGGVVSLVAHGVDVALRIHGRVADRPHHGAWCLCLYYSSKVKRLIYMAKSINENDTRQVHQLDCSRSPQKSAVFASGCGSNVIRSKRLQTLLV